jgi:ribosomal protein L37AE/L43A
MSNVKIVNTDTVPKCPYCDKLLETIERTHTGILGSTVVYICPHCRKLLSIGVNG